MVQYDLTMWKMILLIWPYLSFPYKYYFQLANNKAKHYLKMTFKYGTLNIMIYIGRTVGVFRDFN